MKVTISKRCIIGFTLFFLLALNCKKSDNGSDSTIQLKLDAEGLEYVQLEIGKYFIYKDSTSGMLDSVVVTQSSLENIFTPAVTGGGLFENYPAYNTEVFRLTLTKIDATSETKWLDAQTPSASELCCPSLSNDNEPVQMSESNGALVFCYPMNSCDSVELISSLTVEGKAYENVVKVIGGANGTSQYYWAKDVGLIKRVEKTNPDTKTYTLLRNN